jgi:hypothetical protein
MGAHVDRVHQVPLGNRRFGQSPTLADPDVADQSVDPTERVDGFVNDAYARSLVDDVAHDDRRGGTLTFYEPSRLLGGGSVAIRARHGRAFPRREHRDRSTVAERGIRIVRGARPGPDHDDAAIGQALGHADHVASPGTVGVEAGSPTPPAPGSNVANTAKEEEPMATADEVRDALFERIAYHAISADTDEVLTLARAYNLLVEEDDEDDDDEDDDD